MSQSTLPGRGIALAVVAIVVAFVALKGPGVEIFSSHPEVLLPQGKVRGVLLNDGTYPESIEGFMGIPYALPPLGDLRFRPAVPVSPSDVTIDAFEFGPRCPGRNMVPLPPGADPQSEDCLTINVFRPKGWTANSGKLPVAVLIPGGAFNRGAARMQNTRSMVAWSAEPFIGVSMQYRIGAMGFLNSKLTEQDGLLNLGLKDQIVALEWVQDNIERFGGDPEKVTIMGLSAAAHAIGHLIMNINQNRTIFHQAIMDSGAHTARAVHPPSSELNEQHFKEFLALTGCDGLVDDETLPCLRRAPSSSITEASFAVFTKSDPSVRWAWQPVQDGNIISRRPIDAWKSGKWNKVPILTGHAHNEGSYYAPRSLSTSRDFEDFFATLLPQLSKAELKALCELYPDPAKQGSPYVDTRPIPAGRQYKRGEAAYGQYAYVCPVRQTAHLGTANPDDPPVFIYHWAVNKTVMFGANHGDQPPYETYNPEVRGISETQDAISGYLHAYMTSFIVSGDPNKVPGRYPDRPRWESFAAFDAEKQRTMIFGMGNDERAGGNSKGVVAQFVKDDWAEAECNFWWRQSSNFED